MTSPTTFVLDDFNRANGAVGANWTALVNGFNVSSNQCVGTSAVTFNFMFWNPSTFAADEECYATMAVKVVGTEAFAVYIRMKDTGSVATVDGYLFGVTNAAGTDSLAIQRIDNAVATTIASVSQEVAAGDILMCRAIGSLISGYRMDVATGLWALATSVTDATYAAGGNLGLLMQNATTKADNFGGGAYAAQPIQIRGQYIPGMSQYRAGRMG